MRCAHRAVGAGGPCRAAGSGSRPCAEPAPGVTPRGLNPHAAFALKRVLCVLAAQKLAEDEDDSYVASTWANPQSLKAAFSGVQSVRLPK